MNYRGGVSNPRVEVSQMAEANLQGVVYYIKHSNGIGRICTHANVDIAKFRIMYHQRYMGETHKYPEVVPTSNPKDWPKTLETVEECIRGFQVVYGQPHCYILKDDLIPAVAASATTYRGNGSDYFSHNQ